MKKVLAAAIALTMVVGANAGNTKHVFWYKATSAAAPYNMADATGPNLQGVTDVHGGKALTATIRGSAGNQDPLITLGNGLDNAQARSFVIWYDDLCKLSLTSGATLTSAKFRGEYRDNWMGNAFCNAGPLKPRVGVVKIQGHFDALGVTAASHPDNAVWADPLNPLSGSMGYEMSGEAFQAEQTLNMTALAGANGSGSKPLEGLFFEMDVTTQVRHILNQTVKSPLGIAAVITAGDGSTGKINLYGMEDGVIAGATSDPWTKDGNTCHLVLEVAGGTLAPIAAEVAPVSASKTASISVNPSPCNAVTTISYNTGLAKSGSVKIFNIEGKLVHSAKVSGQNSFVWNAKNLTKGLYVCRIEAGKNIVSRNIIVM
ncbi:MAG: T9SS type A sorting domain-containing protein [Fibrobacteres bacterium]|nr:T9SS type A sorting domain-containing protein [Fibrobacterota bacterium]